MTESDGCNDGREPRVENVADLVAERTKVYSELDLLQQFAMFMGKAQILELALKNVLAFRFGYEHQRTERWTLGRVKNELAELEVRPDFIKLLDSLVDLRNFLAHEFLAAEMIVFDAVGRTGRLNLKHLHRGLWEVEQLLLVVEWQEKHDAWQ